MSFRSEWASDWRRRAADAACHAVLAAALPGRFWYQWLPDLALPALWMHGMSTGRRLRASSRLLLAHRVLHGRSAWSLAFCAAVMLAFGWRGLLHVAAHWGVDAMTHGEGWQ